MKNFQISQVLMLVVFALVVGSQTVSAQQQVAQDAYAILEQNCFSCHGSGGFAAAILLIEDYNVLIEKGAVIPGKPDESKLYNRIRGIGGAQMPLGGPPLPDTAIETIRHWILEGAPDWTVLPSVGHAFSKMQIHAGDTFTLDIRAEDVTNLAGWQFDIVFDPAALEVIDMSEGDFLKVNSGTTSFHGGVIDNAAGTITGLSAERLGDQGVTGGGILLQVRLKAKPNGKTQLTLQNFQFDATTGETIPAEPHEITILVLPTPSVAHAFSETPIHVGDISTLDIRAENFTNLAMWQFDIAFDPTALEVLDVIEGDFLKIDSGTTFFPAGHIDNAAGKITGLNAQLFSDQGVSGGGILLQVRFKAKSSGETQLTLQNLQFNTITGEAIPSPAEPYEITITADGQLVVVAGDVNGDGQVNILDLVLVAQQLGENVPADSPVDANSDGVVNILDLVQVAQGIAGSPAAPTIGTESVDIATIEAWIAQAQVAHDGSVAFQQGIENLQNLLASLIPEKTALHRNYPNPFNPETWIPYQLAVPAEVTLTIYDMKGQLVRRLAVGHQAAGMYQNRSRAAYWDGRNQFGESVASGLYFYTLTAGEFSATRKMLILK